MGKVKQENRNHNQRLPKNNKKHLLVIADRQRRVAECYLKGMTQVEIVDELRNKYKMESSQPTVSNDLREIFSRWEKECITDFEKARLKEIEGLNQLESFAWQELEFSRVRRIKIKPEKGAKDQTVKVVEERQQASVEWHDQIIKVKEKRIELLGLIKKVTNNNSVNIIDPGFWSSMMEEPQGEDPIEVKIESVKLNAVVPVDPV